MFGNSKPFGTPSTFGTSTFGTTSTPFGQSTNTFGAKPAANNVFGGSAFGMSTPSAPMSSGLFGTNTPTTSTGLFGQPTTAFGAPASTGASGFGFGATSTSGNLFGATAPSTQSSGGLFGNTTSSAFGTPRLGFGGFGTTNTSGTAMFGQSTTTGAGLFSNTAGGFGATAVPPGTTIKFNAVTGTDTMMKGGISTSIGTRHQCITCMREYENKSLEELRMEDYAANRKGGSATGLGFGTPAQTSGGLFGAPAASSSAFSFGGTTQSKPLFGTTGTTNAFGSTGGLFGQAAPNQNAGLFGKTVGFGTPATSAAPAFNFAGTTGTSLFGQTNQQKPLFGQTTGGTGLFGNTATTQGSAFGTGTTAFGGFGATNQPSTGLFGAKPTGFGTANTTTTNSFSFGPTNTLGTGGLFGQKPAGTAFGTSTGFGTPASSFGAFGTTPAAGTGLFGQTKPATSTFGTGGNMFGTGLGTSFGTPSFPMGIGTNTGTGLFGNTTANKPGFSFGNAGSTGFNFGATNPTSSFNFGTSQAATGDPNACAALQHAQQQILAMTVNPFGDSPLFRNQIREISRETEVLRPTNPSAQKALLNDNHYKVSLLPTAKIKPKPWSPAPTGKMLLFDGLEDEEPSLGSAIFLPKKSVKKLVLRNLNNSQSSLTLTSNISPTQATRIDVSISLNKTNTDSPLSKVSSPSENILDSPLTVDINDSNISHAETRRVSARKQTGSPIFESSPETPISSDFNISFNNSLNDSIAALHTNKQALSGKTYKVWSEAEDSFRDSSIADVTSPDPEMNTDSIAKKHLTGITLTRPSYYTKPSLDEMIPLIGDSQTCMVKDFCIGRTGYGEVIFPGMTNVFGLNLDEIVTFGKKEINVYPDDENKPPMGKGLNRSAKVVLRNVWPTDKTNHCPIKDTDRINKMGYKEKIERCTNQLGAKFIDYIVETGSWIFEVDHFSKYGLEDSDEEMDTQSAQNQLEKKPPPLPKKQPEQLLSDKFLPPKVHVLGRQPISSFHVRDQEMKAFSSQLMSCPLDFIEDDLLSEVTSPRQALSSEIDADRIQGMKAFFQEVKDEEHWGLMFNEKPDTYFSPKKNGHYEDGIVESKLWNKSSVHKRQRFLGEKFSVPSPVQKQIDIGIQNSMSSLTITTAKLPDWYSELPPVEESLRKVHQPSKTVPLSLNKIVIKPFEKSVLFEKQHLLSDAGYFKGRSFRVGWRADGSYVNAATAHDNQSKEGYEGVMFLHTAAQVTGRMTNTKSNFGVSIKSLLSQHIDNENKIESITEALQMQLENSASTMENGTPLFVPKLGVNLIHLHATLFEHLSKNEESILSEVDFIRQCVCVWDLLISLWGRVRGLEDEQDTSNYSTQMARREALSQWLIKSTDRDISKAIASKDDYLSKIFLYLNGRRPADAVKLAQQHRDFRLSLLLSQSESNSVVRKLIGKQLSNWQHNETYLYIKPNRMILYALLSGRLVYNDVSCCKDLRWKQVLALMLWYHCNPNGSIQEVLDEYDKSFQGSSSDGKYACPPYPPYIEDTIPMDEEDAIFDTCYHLLKLYSDRSHRLDWLLMPETYTHDHLDYRMSWLLHLALSSIGYNIPADLSSTLCMNFSSQLESLGSWEWAIFVLLHLSDKDIRCKQVKDILLRSVSLEQTDEIKTKENFLMESLMVPEKWIFEAKAVKANALGKKAEEAWYLLKAESWSKSHNIVIKHLASDAVINEDYDYLMKYLSKLALPERCCTILDWSNGGQVYLDYINMCKVMESIVCQEVDAYILEKFKPEVVSLCDRLSSIPATSLKDRLSIAEMAKKTATTLRSILILQASRMKDANLLTTLASSIKNLPMPHDYAVSDYRFVAHAFLEAGDF